MLTRKFVLENDSDGDFQGWKPLFVDSFDPGTGYVAAHDVLEHAHGDTGTLEQEMMALGRFWWLRLDSGYADFHATIHFSKGFSLGMGMSRSSATVKVRSPTPTTGKQAKLA